MKIRIKRIIQILAGILFVASGFLKAVDSQGFSVLITNYGFHWAGYMSPVISSVEIILGLCLILDIMPGTTALLVAGITMLFTLAFTYAFFSKGIEDCGCMGSFRFLKVPPYISFTRNILIIGGCFWIWKSFRNEVSKTRNWKKWTVYVIGGFSIGLSSFTLGVPVIEKNELHKGEQISSNILRFYGDIISKGTSFVYIFSPDCSHCWNNTGNINSIREIPGFSNVIGVTQFGDTTEYMKEMKPNFPVFIYPTGELSEVISEVPVLLVLENGKIEKIFRTNEIPCGKILKRMLDNEGK